MSASALLARYSLAGVVNTAISYLVIFCCMQAGFEPTTSNMLGYAVGLATSFVQSRYWVFRSVGRVRDEWPGFILVFVLAYAANLVTLRLLLGVPVNAYLAQFLACGVYIGASFVLNSRFVFRKRKQK